MLRDGVSVLYIALSNFKFNYNYITIIKFQLNSMHAIYKNNYKSVNKQCRPISILINKDILTNEKYYREPHIFTEPR